MNPFPVGTAPIKPEYILSIESRPIPDDDAAEGATNVLNGRARSGRDGQEQSSGPMRGAKLSKQEKKERRGANKGRRFAKVRDELELCWKVASGRECEFGAECRFTHDIKAYTLAKPRDIHFSPSAEITNSPPFVLDDTDTNFSAVDDDYPSLDFETTCPIFLETGECPHGLKCRFLGSHVRKEEDGTLCMLSDSEKRAHTALSAKEVNFIDAEALKLLRSKKYPLPITDSYMKEIQDANNESEAKQVAKPTVNDMEQIEGNSISEEAVKKRTGEVTSQSDTPDVPSRFSEKKRLNWSHKTYLAPLTTVGNLPFRRICVDFGADITCGEMGLVTSFLAGSKEEWSLVRRHPSESTFGVQLAGNKAATFVSTAEFIAKECAGNVDFVDINCGCPIDLVFRAGSGSALLDAPGKLGKIILGMNKALGEIPVTVKIRTGVKEGKPTAHKLMPRLDAEFGASCVSIHGRSRQQRYTRLADWDYIKQCVEAVRAREAEEDLHPIPIFGGGDCFSSQDYWNAVENCGVDGVMAARGALIKPWLFTEIKERREWDISSRERLESIRKLAEYGINHFGSDTAGVNTARRYLCEALSFQYRYVPIGLLEYLPGRINDRPPAFRGRDDLETLLASGDSRDWVKISEMFLGPAPKSWTFTPKHRSNTYGNEESQG